MDDMQIDVVVAVPFKLDGTAKFSDGQIVRVHKCMKIHKPHLHKKLWLAPTRSRSNYEGQPPQSYRNFR